MFLLPPSIPGKGIKAKGNKTGIRHLKLKVQSVLNHRAEQDTRNRKY